MASPPTQPRSTLAARRRYPLWRLIRANIYDFVLLLRESWVMLMGFIILQLAGALYLVVYAHMGLAAALYETLKLLALQSGLDLPADPLGELLFFLVPMLGLALVLQSVLNFGRLLLDKSSRRESWQVALASTYRDHVIVCGLGRVSLHVVLELLESGYEPVVIEHNWESEFVERVLNLKVPIVKGDAREAITLYQAGLARARAVVAAINEDLTNIEIALTVRSVQPELRVILRVFAEELDRNLERGFGPNTAFSTSALAAPTYAAAAVSREVDYVLPMSTGLLGIAHLTICSGSPLIESIHAIEEQYNVRVLQHFDATGSAMPRVLSTQTASNHTITLIGTLDTLETLRLCNIPRTNRPIIPPRLEHPTEQYDTILVCGLGKVGYRVVRQLYQLHPRPRIVVIRLGDDLTDFPQQISRLQDVTTHIGDARDLDVLSSAGIDRVYTVIALTSDDLLNLQIGLAARQLRPDVHVVLRVFSDMLAEKLTDIFNFDTIYSTSGLASPTLAAAAVLGDITHAFAAAGTLFSADPIVIQAGDALAGLTIDAIRQQHYAFIIELQRNDTHYGLPALTTILAPGDTVTLLASLDALAKIRRTLNLRPH